MANEEPPRPQATIFETGWYPRQSIPAQNGSEAENAEAYYQYALREVDQTMNDFLTEWRSAIEHTPPKRGIARKAQAAITAIRKFRDEFVQQESLSKANATGDVKYGSKSHNLGTITNLVLMRFQYLANLWIYRVNQKK